MKIKKAEEEKRATPEYKKQAAEEKKMRMDAARRRNAKLDKISRVKMYTYGSPMSKKLSNTVEIEKKEVGNISLPNHWDTINYKDTLAKMTVEMGGDTLIDLREKFFRDKDGEKVTLSAIVLKLD